MPLVLLLLRDLEGLQLPTEFQEADDLADVVPLGVVVLVFFGYDEGEGFFDALHADPEVEEGQIEVEEVFEALVQLVIQLEGVNEREQLDWPLVRLDEPLVRLDIAHTLEVLMDRVALVPL